MQDKNLDKLNLVKKEFISKAEEVQKQLTVLGKDIKYLNETKLLFNKIKVYDKQIYQEIKNKIISLEEIRKNLFLQKENFLMKESVLNNLDKIIQNIFISINNKLKNIS